MVGMKPLTLEKYDCSSVKDWLLLESFSTKQRSESNGRTASLLFEVQTMSGNIINQDFPLIFHLLHPAVTQIET